MKFQKIIFNQHNIWIDIIDPTKTELIDFLSEYHFPKHFIDDSLEIGHLPKYDFTEDTKFIISRFVNNFELNELKSIQEFTSKIAFLVQDHLLITIHRLDVDFISNINEEYLASKSIYEINDLTEHLLYRILKTYEEPAFSIEKHIDTLEERIFLKQINNNLSKEFYILKRESSSMKKLLSLKADILKGMEKNGFKSRDFFGLKDLQIKLISTVEQNIDDVSNLINLFYAISSQKTNDIMKTLTILSIFFMPLTFIAGIYGMNFEHMPELKWVYGYPLTLLVMALISLSFYRHFKNKKWF